MAYVVFSVKYRPYATIIAGMKDDVRQAAEILWDYMQLNEPAADAECFLVIGSLNDDVATYAAEVENSYTFGLVVISGGVSRIDKTRTLGWGEDSEAEHYLKLMRIAGCKRQDILLETEARNTGENASLTYRLLSQHGTIPETLLIVSKPYMERRTRATFDVQWQHKSTTIRTTSPPGSLWQYCKDKDSIPYTINVMVGDLQRIIEYPKRGYQSYQPVSHEVLDAFELLVNAGFTQHTIN